ncbi:unnamed protein product [Protopolystoma xenopodis]|uniref:Uncharacterized protein n=1 Tax=Protopolystoma xenopodis TaxID=117903 RepID=A0A448X9V7_9PLAT|nr:unnamed protein product [Protopolystoma xenopodis]
MPDTSIHFVFTCSRLGLETSPWDLSANNELHVIGDISLACQQWLLTCLPAGVTAATSVADQADFAMGVDALTWYRCRGRKLLSEIARFWASRMTYSEDKAAFEILGQLCL